MFCKVEEQSCQTIMNPSGIPYTFNAPTTHSEGVCESLSKGEQCLWIDIFKSTFYKRIKQTPQTIPKGS